MKHASKVSRCFLGVALRTAAAAIALQAVLACSARHTASDWSDTHAPTQLPTPRRATDKFAMLARPLVPMSLLARRHEAWVPLLYIDERNFWGAGLLARESEVLCGTLNPEHVLFAGRAADFRVLAEIFRVVPSFDAQQPPIPRLRATGMDEIDHLINVRRDTVEARPFDVEAGTYWVAVRLSTLPAGSGIVCKVRDNPDAIAFALSRAVYFRNWDDLNELFIQRGARVQGLDGEDATTSSLLRALNGVAEPIDPATVPQSIREAISRQGESTD